MKVGLTKAEYSTLTARRFFSEHEYNNKFKVFTRDWALIFIWCDTFLSALLTCRKAVADKQEKQCSITRQKVTWF